MNDDRAAKKPGGDAGLPPELADLLGKRIGNFVLSKVLGQGGMGAVFEAEHPALGKQVAIKFLSPIFAGAPDMASRFLAEARTAASLQHPNIVDILDFGEFEERPYYVMQRLEGSDLAARIKLEGRFPVEEVGAYLTQIGSALDLAHGRGVIHRDLKPANVFVLAGSPLRVKLLDFGIAKSLARDEWATRTQSGQILGTPSHMAPEQVLGSTNEIGPQTDLYALGAILYEMLTGKPVFAHPSGMMLMMMHVRDPFTPVRTLASDVPEGVARAVERCLAKAPGDRPRSAGELTREFLDAIGASSAPMPTVDASVIVAARGAHASMPDPVPTTGLAERGAPSIGVAVTEPMPPPVRVSADYPAAPTLAVPFAPVADPPPPAPAPAKATPPAPAKVAPPAAPPAPIDTSTELTETEQATLTKLLQRMQRKGDFPAFMTNVTEISRKAQLSSSSSARQLGDTILKDYALTAKLLRIVNSSYYERFGKKVNNVSRAVVVLGFEQIRSIALSIAIHKNPGKNNAHSDEIAEQSISSLVSGEIARKLALAVGLKNGEEAHVCAMFRNMGHQLVTHYLPDEYEAMKRLMETQGLSLDGAASQVLGVSLRKLSIGVMQKWRMSPRIAASMNPTAAGEKVRTDDDRLRVVSAFSNELCATIATSPAESRDEAVAALLARYKGSINIPPQQVPGLLTSVHDSFKDRYATLLNLDPEKSVLFRNVRAMAAAAAPAPSLDPAAPPLPAHDTARGAAGAGAPPPQAAPIENAKALALDKRLSELEALVREPHDPGEMAKMVLEAFGSGFGFRRVLVFAQGKERATMRVAAAWGEDAAMLSEEFCVPISSSLATDVFSVAWHTGQNISITDAFDEKSTARVPRVYYEFLGSMAFVIYPSSTRGAGAKLLFADTDTPSQLPASDEMVYVNRFRVLMERSAAQPAAAHARDIRPLAPKRI